MKKIALNEAEWRCILYALNKLRTSLINEGRYTDVVDEVMLKIINAPIKKVKIAKNRIDIAHKPSVPKKNRRLFLCPVLKTQSRFRSSGWKRRINGKERYPHESMQSDCLRP